jgi:hypothetical protein
MSSIIKFPKAKASAGRLDIFVSSHGWRGFDAVVPVDLSEQVISMIEASGARTRWEAPEDRPTLRSKGKRSKGSVHIYRGGCGMRGIDAMVPIDLADKSVALIKGRFHAGRFRAGRLISAGLI